ncbi:MAG: EAL domain-containing protein [Rhizobiaceae bacterium]|nr:EAL domain-containing protein [Rhizobiaceae bacterium]
MDSIDGLVCSWGSNVPKIDNTVNTSGKNSDDHSSQSSSDAAHYDYEHSIHNATEKLIRQHQQFEMAIANITHGLCMFDSNEKLIISNDHYATIFSLTPDMIKPGMFLAEIMQLRIEKGCFIDEEFENFNERMDEWLKNFIDKAEIIQLKDGRYVEMLKHPMADGGWLSTQEDVTDRVNAQMALVDYNERLDVALETMAQGLCMFGPDKKIIVSNDQYAEIYRISPELIKPGTELKEILKLRVENGTYSGSSPEEYLQGRRVKLPPHHNHTDVKIHHLHDGRYIEIRDHPMADGGWLSTHEDITERYLSETQIQNLANFDSLTGLPNRTQIRNVLRVAIDDALKNGTKISLLYVDLDEFKEINDTLGHPVGDSVLRQIGARIGALQGETITAGRIAADEFIVIVEGTDDVDELRHIGDRICTELAVSIHVDHNVINISASVGISFGPPEDGSVDSLFQHSDLALHRAKADGGNSVSFFEEKMLERTQMQQRLAVDMRNAVLNDELRLHYQPQVDMRTGEINGYEALVRWQHPELGLIYPDQFIGLAEKTGQINALGDWCLRTACENAMSWPNEDKISVNLSPVQFKRQDVLRMVETALWDTGLPPERLELEITESVLIIGTDSVITTLKTLSEMGVSIALDDFGTGFSSLSYLTTFPFNKIKIDKSFVDELVKGTEVTPIIRMIIGLGRSLNATITAEGIETSNQHALLRAAGCHQGQGYIYGKPLPEILEAGETTALIFG